MQGLLPAGSQPVEVTLEDQQRINAFSRLHLSYQERREERERARRELDDLESASTQLMDLESEDVRPMLLCGSSYYPGEALELDERLEAVRAAAKARHEAAAAECERLASQLDELRAALEAKFRDAINLNYEK